MELECSLQYSQEPAIRAYPELIEFCLHASSFQVSFGTILPSVVSSPSLQVFGRNMYICEFPFYVLHVSPISFISQIMLKVLSED